MIAGGVRAAELNLPGGRSSGRPRWRAPAQDGHPARWRAPASSGRRRTRSQN